MTWKKSLDKFLTAEPADNLTPWCELVYEDLTDEFYNMHTEWLDSYNGQCNTWLNKLYNKSKDPKVAAQIIQRAFTLYKQ